jgi:hypothetical protein
MMSSRTSERNKSSGLLSDWQPARKSQRDVFQTLRMNRTQWKMPQTRYRNPSPGTAWRTAPLEEHLYFLHSMRLSKLNAFEIRVLQLRLFN